MSANNRERELWRLMVIEGLRYDEVSNTQLPFVNMSKKYGKAWVDYLKAAWFVRNELSTEEFCRLHGGVPTSFVEKHLTNV